MVEYEEFELTDGNQQGYLLKTHLTLEGNETAEDAFGQLVEALYGWIDARGTGFGGLEVTMLAPKDLHETLIGFMLALVEQETGLREFFLEVGTINVKFGESYEAELSEFTIEVDKDENPDEQSQAA